VKRELELLAPGGDVDSIKAAIAAGADAVYCGLDRFNARNRATNISFENLQGILRLAQKNNCQVFLTLNIIVLDSEIPALIGLLNKLVNTNIDGVIVQDIGLFYLLSNYFKDLKIHASTQATTHNKGQIQFLSKLSAIRVNLSRELNIHEIKALSLVGEKNNISTEVFVHGSYCISFSGICYFSSVHGGNSGNRGRCSQPCRDQFVTTDAGKNYPLNLKDNSAFFDLAELRDAGVSSLKIEGRMKKFDYVYTVVNSYQKQLQNLHNQNRPEEDNSDLYKVFNRDFSNSFLKGDIDSEMFIDNPRDHSIQHLSEIKDYSSQSELEKDQLALYDEKEKNKAAIQGEINQLSIARIPLTISISGECGSPLKVSVKIPDASFAVASEINLADKGKQPLNREMVLKRFKTLNNEEYFIKDLTLEDIQNDVYIPFKELTSIKNKLLFILNGSKEIVDPISVPVLEKQKREEITPSLSVLISSPEDVYICNKTAADIYFELPNCFENDAAEFIDLFAENPALIPWFPSILIGNDYTTAIEFLQKVRPRLIATNNTGIAYAAFEMGIPWIAGPYLNIVNSFSLLCLKEKFNCYGAFISNEISKNQLKNITMPKDFKLYYSIYHPIVLMTSRQCLFHQVIGCGKSRMDDTCIHECDKSASITNLNKTRFLIEKSKGSYHNVFNETAYLNTDIVTEVPDLFSSFFIDLRSIITGAKIEMDKPEIIELFESLLNGNPESTQKLKQVIQPSTNTQFVKGI